MKHVV